MNKVRRQFGFGLAVVMATTILISCGNFNGQLDPAREKLEQARKNGAQWCAPIDFAAAEANFDFAENASHSGDRINAEIYLSRAKERIDQALAACKNCKSDLDGDGLPDRLDGDPYRAEDFDGIQDEDGIPDYDNDGDGIPDLEDQCPNEPEDFDGFQDEDGCPDPDNDFDGIPDVIDQCPNEPEDIDGFQDSDGCPDPDNDNDGFPDTEDACPNDPETKNGFLDNDGCPDQLPQKRKFIPLPSVKFLAGSIYLPDEDRENLKAFAERLKKNPELYLHIESHTYASGDPNADLELTRKRADMIKDFLIGLGVAPARIAALGLGSTQPIADNETFAGQQKNDRIDLIIYLR